MLYSLLLTALLPALTLNGQEATTQPKMFPVQEAHTIMVNGSSQQTFTPIRSASTSEIEVTPSESINGIVPWYSQPDELESKSFYRSG